jgi:hypothetical protein
LAEAGVVVFFTTFLAGIVTDQWRMKKKKIIPFFTTQYTPTNQATRKVF